jgi:hypothetical protein
VPFVSGPAAWPQPLRRLASRILPSGAPSARLEPRANLFTAALNQRPVASGDKRRRFSKFMNKRKNYGDFFQSFVHAVERMMEGSPVKRIESMLADSLKL